MTERAAQAVDALLPHVPLRQRHFHTDALLSALFPGEERGGGA
jgi:hypothetical protein